MCREELLLLLLLPLELHIFDIWTLEQYLNTGLSQQHAGKENYYEAGGRGAAMGIMGIKLQIAHSKTGGSPKIDNIRF